MLLCSLRAVCRRCLHTHARCHRKCLPPIGSLIDCICTFHCFQPVTSHFPINANLGAKAHKYLTCICDTLSPCAGRLVAIDATRTHRACIYRKCIWKHTARSELGVKSEVNYPCIVNCSMHIAVFGERFTDQVCVPLSSCENCSQDETGT